MATSNIYEISKAVMWKKVKRKTAKWTTGNEIATLMKWKNIHTQDSQVTESYVIDRQWKSNIDEIERKNHVKDSQVKNSQVEHQQWNRNTDWIADSHIEDSQVKNNLVKGQ